MAYFNYENKKVFYQVAGKGEPLLLLPGNTASSMMFDSVLEMYSKEFQVIVIDFPGHGKSDRLEKFKTDFWFYNSCVCYALIEELNLEKVSVIGTSGGALVGINLALEYPEKIKYLVADSFEGEYPLSSYINSLKADREAGKTMDELKGFWAFNHGNDWEKVVDLDTEMLLNFHKQGTSFFHKSISEISVPAILTGSKQDEFCDYLDKIYAGLKAKNKSLEIHLFETGGHPAMLSNYEEFYKLVKEKLKLYP